MAPDKTVPTAGSVKAFVDAIEPDALREDARALLRLMREASGKRPTMWGPSIIGFGSHHYKYASGREGDTPAAGFAARKTGLVLYGLTDVQAAPALFARLGKHRQGVGCVYVKRLQDIDQAVLKKLVEQAVLERT